MASKFGLAIVAEHDFSSAAQLDIICVPGGPARSMWPRDRKSSAAICQKAGISDCTIHDLRHTYASVLANRGLSLHLIGALLGHTKTATTARYAHLSDDPFVRQPRRQAPSSPASLAPRSTPFTRGGHEPQESSGGRQAHPLG